MCQYAISTHDLTKRSTNDACEKIRELEDFNSRPHEEVDQEIPDIKNEIHISTHDLTKRSTIEQTYSVQRVVFQLTTSRRGRLITPSGTTKPKSNFNSRPHEEVDYTQLYRICAKKYFNSRPHEEVDDYLQTYANTGREFQLTTSRRGRPQRVPQSPCKAEISTHDLTKRSTLLRTIPTLYLMHFNSRPHEEVDQRIAALEAEGGDFNSRPHEEVDHTD